MHPHTLEYAPTNSYQFKLARVTNCLLSHAPQVLKTMSLPPCPQCQSEYVYQDQSLLVCPECGYEWNPEEEDDAAFTVKDANGTKLEVGDAVTFVKDLKVKGSSQVLKIGTKALIRRIVEGKDHELDCKVTGAGEMMITAKFVKKA